MAMQATAAVIFVLFTEPSGVVATHRTGIARAEFSAVSPVARRRYEMTDTEHEAGSAGRSITRLMPGEIFAILAFWAFLAVLTAAGRLVDPRVAAVAAMRAARRPELTSGFEI